MTGEHRDRSNKQLALDFLTAMGTGDSAWFERHLAPDFVWINPQHSEHSPLSGGRDRAGFITLAGALLDRMPDGLRVECRGITAEGDRVAVEAESFGQTVAGEYNNRYHFLFEFKDGLIVVGKEYADSAYMAAFAEKLRRVAGG